MTVPGAEICDVSHSQSAVYVTLSQAAGHAQGRGRRAAGRHPDARRKSVAAAAAPDFVEEGRECFVEGDDLLVLGTEASHGDAAVFEFPLADRE